MTPYEYAVLLHPAAEGGFWAEVPALPGCLAQGETVEETLANVQEAAEAHLQALRNEGRTVPEEGGGAGRPGQGWSRGFRPSDRR